MTDGFLAWIDGLRPRFGKMADIAALIGISESGLTRGAKRGRLRVENLLDLARATDEHPSRVLRLAGRDDVADLLECLYGPGKDALTKSQREVVELWDRVPEENREPLLVTMRVFAVASVSAQPDTGRAGSRATPDETPAKGRARRRSPRRSAGRPGDG